MDLDVEVEEMLSEWPEEGISLDEFHALLAGESGAGGCGLHTLMSGVNDAATEEHMDDLLEDARRGSTGRTRRDS